MFNRELFNQAFKLFELSRNIPELESPNKSKISAISLVALNSILCDSTVNGSDYEDNDTNIACIIPGKPKENSTDTYGGIYVARIRYDDKIIIVYYTVSNETIVTYLASEQHSYYITVSGEYSAIDISDEDISPGTGMVAINVARTYFECPEPWSWNVDDHLMKLKKRQ